MPTNTRRRHKIPSESNLFLRFITIFLTTLGIGVIAIIGFITIFANIDVIWNFLNPEEEQEYDNIPPASPTVIPLPPFINKETITIEGYTEKAATVTLFAGDLRTEEGIADNDGRFSFDEVRLHEGENRFYLISKDQAGNESPKSEEIIIVLDKERPRLEISEPTNGQQFQGEDKKQIRVRGKSEPGSSVTVNDSFAIVDTSGNFSYFLTLQPGENIIKIKAEDRAGNVDEKDLTALFSP